jgi:hypothetical protein
MPGRMPILGRHGERKHTRFQQLADRLDNRIAAAHSERATRQEVGLHVDYQQARMLSIEHVCND